MVVLTLKAHRNSFVSSRRRNGYYLQQDAGAKWHLPGSAFQMGSYLQEDAMLICVTGAKWHLPGSAFHMGSYLQEDAVLICVTDLQQDAGVLLSATRCRCEVASALQRFPNGIVSARRCCAHLRHRSLARSGICPAVLGKWERICKKMLICVQHKHPIAHVDVERHLGFVLLSFGILLHE